MKSKRGAIERHNQPYFNCLYSEIYSYMKHLEVPIDLLLYRCLEEPQHLYEQLVVNGKTRWGYEFDVLTEDDFRCIGVKPHILHGTFTDLKATIRRVLAAGELVFLSVDSFYFPHRIEYNDRHESHWVMLTDYDERTDAYTIMDEVHTYYDLFEYEEEAIATAYSHDSRMIIHFTRIPADYERLRTNYLAFYKHYSADHGQLFHTLIPKLKGHLEGSSEHAYIEGICRAYSLLSGSALMMQKFVTLLACRDEIADAFAEIASLTDILTVTLRKFLMTSKLTLSAVEDQLTALQQAYDSCATYVRSASFADHILSLSFEEVLERSAKSSGATGEVEESLHEQAVQQPHMIDLSASYNNQAFGGKQSDADLTGGGEHYLLDEAAEELNVVTVGDVAYRMHEPLGRGCDNIACQGQALELESRAYSGICLLGCGEWGDQIGTFKVQDEEGEAESIKVQLTDWAWTPKFGETVVLTYPIYRKNSQTPSIDQGRIFAVHYPLKRGKRVSKLLLPVCPSMHIFALTMLSSEPAIPSHSNSGGGL